MSAAMEVEPAPAPAPGDDGAGAAAPDAWARPRRSRLSEAVRKQIGLPPTPQHYERDPAAHAARRGAAAGHGRQGEFARRATAGALRAVALEAAAAQRAALPPAEPMLTEGESADVRSPQDDSQVHTECDDADVLQVLDQLWADVKAQALLIANPAGNNNTDFHRAYLCVHLGQPRLNPVEHMAVIQRQKAALQCPQCPVFPCRTHTTWAHWNADGAGLSRVVEARSVRMGLTNGAPHPDNVAPWSMNVLKQSVADLQKVRWFVRSAGGVALAAYGPDAFPLGLLTRGDACVSFICQLQRRSVNKALLQQLQQLAAARVAHHGAPVGADAVRDALASDLLACEVLRTHLAHEAGAGLDAAQQRMAQADTLHFCAGEAGPGAGKTRALVGRVAHLYCEGALPHHVHVLTFTRKAVAELRTRLSNRQLPMPVMVTLTSFVARLLSAVCRETQRWRLALLCVTSEEADAMHADDGVGVGVWVERPMTMDKRIAAVLSSGNRQDVSSLATALAKELAKELRRAGASWHTENREVMCRVARATLNLAATGWSKSARQAAASLPLPLLQEVGDGAFVASDEHLGNLCAVLAKIRAQLHALANAGSWPVVGSDAAQLAAGLVAAACGRARGAGALPLPVWAAGPEVTAAVLRVLNQMHPAYYVQDEVQDTDAAQFELFAHLGAFGATKPSQCRLTVVGDCDQAIYSFRGASVAKQHEVSAQLFPLGTFTRIELATNYRSTPAIVAVSCALVSQNYLHAAPGSLPQKQLVAKRAAGVPVQLACCNTRAVEYARILAEIDAWRAAGLALGKGGPGEGDGMAVVFWRNADKDAFAEQARRVWARRSDRPLVVLGKDDAPAASGTSTPAVTSGSLVIGTIHSVKGLEYEVLFLAGLGDMAPDKAMAHLPKTWASHADWVLKTVPDPGEACCEIRRLLYVAASRARSLLHVSYAGAEATASEVVGVLRQLPTSQVRVVSCDSAMRAATLAAAPHSVAELMSTTAEAGIAPAEDAVMQPAAPPARRSARG